MTVIEWLLSGDPALTRLVKKHLLEEDAPYEKTGLIEKYIALYNPETRMWGGGLYTPKWTSTHYTMCELKYLGTDPNTEAYREGLTHLLEKLWTNKGRIGKRHKDICVVAMLLSLATYAKSENPKLIEMTDYILGHQFEDGGFNCEWDHPEKRPHKSSLHTTISVLEAFKDYRDNGYTHRLDDVESATRRAENFILDKRFYFNSAGEIIHHDFTEAHYPTRWKYDYLRALEYFAAVKKPRDDRMEEALNRLTRAMDKGYLTKGRTYSGKIHFRLEKGMKGRFNTYRALKVLKFYCPAFYKQVIRQQI